LTVARVLREHRVGCVVESRDGKDVNGLVAARDIAYALAERADWIRRALGTDILDAPVSRIMEVHTCNQELRCATS
jgi:hypothetical protein